MRQLHELVTTLGQDLKRRYGERIHKLTLHGGFGCPNRDGTLGRGGCTFCNVAAFAEEQAAHHSIAAQLQARQAELKVPARRYFAYFQAYTATLAEVEVLRARYEQALATPDIDLVGLCVGTRPDCVPDEVITLLQGYVARGYEVWLELGLQSAHNKTLHRINRGHDWQAYVDVIRRLRGTGIRVCTHLILGLPGETFAMQQQTLAAVLAQGVDGLKLHPLMIVEGAVMARAWQAGRLPVLTLDDYVAIAGPLIQQTPRSVVFHRVCATARPPTLLAPQWCAKRWPPLTALARYLDQYGEQGSLISPQHAVLS